MLLARGANPNARVNTTPFRGFYQVSANWANFDGQTPFLRAALSGDVTLMRLLLEHGADPQLDHLRRRDAADGGRRDQLGGGADVQPLRARSIWKPPSCASSTATT